jgi:drug/metabolite transporter (DMT)-like permease
VSENYLIGLGIAIVCAIAWSGLDLTRKFMGAKVTATAAVAGLTLFQLPILLAIMSATEFVLPAEGFHRTIGFHPFPDVPLEYWWYGAGTVAINVAANFLFLRAVQISPISLTIPYLAFTPVFSAFTAMATFGETPTMSGWAGILIVCVGAFTLNPGNKENGPFAPLFALWQERGSFYMLLVALLWSVTPVVDKQGSNLTNGTFQTFAIASGVAAVFIVMRTVKDRGPGKLVGELRLAAGLFAIGALLNVTAMILQLASYSFTEIAYVETIKRAIGVIASIAAGYFLFKEGDVGRRLFGAAVMVVGVAFIMLG